MTNESGDGITARSAIIRYVYPGVDPWNLDPDDFARLWREADYIVKTFGLITRRE